jgi:hypothetical protein
LGKAFGNKVIGKNPSFLPEGYGAQAPPTTKIFVIIHPNKQHNNLRRKFMNSVQQILAQMAKTNPVINQALTYSQKSDFTKFDEIKPLLAKYQNQIKILPYSLTVYWPDRAFAEGEYLMSDMTHLFKGATWGNGFIGSWENSHT